MNPAFWSGRRVLVTGHTGFKGSWLSLWLQSLGAEVSGFALAPPTDPSLFAVARVAEGMRSINADIRDAQSLDGAFRQARPEVVIHMAAQALVREGYASPVETYATNVMGTVNVLDAVRRFGDTRSVIVVSSDKCYENREWAWGYRENDSLGGRDPYSSSKACTELVTAAYRDAYFNPQRHAEHRVAVASARAGNVIGGGDWARDRLVPDVLRSLAASEPARIRNPGAIRPWQHALEALDGYLTLAELLATRGPDEYTGAWNFGPSDDDMRTVQWLVERLAAKWGAGASWIADDGRNPHEAHFLKLDCSKARALLAWRPRWSLETALDGTVDWHRRWLAGEDMRKHCLGQIADYQSGQAVP
jgi:CDP-glucose 4,6-dehydratase